MSSRLFLLLFFVSQMAGTAVALWLLAALDGCWWPFGPRYTVVKLNGKEDRSLERTDSEGGADGAQDVVRGARQDDFAGSDGTLIHTFNVTQRKADAAETARICKNLEKAAHLKVQAYKEQGRQMLRDSEPSLSDGLPLPDLNDER